MSAFFSGFEESRKRFTGIPEQFFSEILPGIDDLDELKITLYLLWSAYTEGDFGLGFTSAEIKDDQKFSAGIIDIDKHLEKAAADQILISVDNSSEREKRYFLNTPRGRAAAELFRKQGEEKSTRAPKTTLDMIKPNIFKLYEENIGPLTPLIADALKDAQNTYPEAWVSEAIQIAVKNNVRRWKYIESILKRWLEEGRDGTDPRHTQEDYERYLKGEYGDIGKHW